VAQEGGLYELTLRSGSWSVIELVPTAKPPSHLEKVYTLDLQDPTDPKEIVEYTRTAIAAAEKAKPLRKHQFRWPRGAGPRAAPAGPQGFLPCQVAGA